MSRCNSAASRGRGQQRHHLVLGNGRGQSFADKIIWVGHNAFRHLCRDNRIGSQI
jgi:hypothetical protein